MLQTLDLGADHILAFQVEGGLDVANVRAGFAALDRALARHDRLRVYLEVRSLPGVTLHALWKEVELGLERFDAVARIERAALVTDLAWLRGGSVLQNRAFRGIEIRAFAPADEQAARSWIRG